MARRSASSRSSGPAPRGGGALARARSPRPPGRRAVALRALACLAALLLAGCTGGDGDGGTGGTQTSPPAGRGDPLPPLSWPILNVETTHTEPEPQRGDLLVAWRDGLFGVSAPGEGDLPARSVVEGGVVYSTNQDLGWIRQDLQPAMANGQLSTRYHLWDLKGLAESPDLERTVTVAGAITNVTGVGTFRSGTYELPVMYALQAEAGQVRLGYVRSDLGRESPFFFRAAEYDFPFEVQVPDRWRSAADVLVGDADASRGHDVLLRLVNEHLRTRGSLPEEVSPDSLRLEMLATGVTWPDNPYTGEPMADARASGGFTWTRCSLQDGRFVGLGWDGPLVSRGFGRSCR